MAYNHTFFDTRFNRDVLDGNISDPAEYLFQETYDRLAKMEVEAAGLERGDEIAHVGTGWPGTAIAMYLNHGLAVTCIEIDPKVAQDSRLALEQLGLYGPGKIQVICKNGALLNLERFKCVLVSAMVPNDDKATIKQNLAKLAAGKFQSNVRMIIRGPAHEATSLFYQPATDDLTRGTRTVVDDFSQPTGIDPLVSTAFRPGGATNPVRGDGGHSVCLQARQQLLEV